MPVAELIIFFATPLLAGWLARRKGLGWLDPVLTCYGVGLLLANSPFAVDEAAAQTVTEAVVPLAIPLLLFQTDFLRWLKSSRAALLGFAIATFSSLASLLAWSLLLRDLHQDLWMVGGMLSGTWVGGSPNLVSVGTALAAPRETFLLTNAADVFVCGFYLLALLTFARPLLRRFLREPDAPDPLDHDDMDDEPLSKRIREGVLSTMLATMIVAASAGLSLLLFDELSTPWIIFGITSGGIAASFATKVRALAASYDVGNYLILVFCVAIGALTDLAALLESGSAFLTFAIVAMTTTLLLHYTLCALLKLDVDTAIITSVAAIMGPALVVPVAKRLDSRAAFVTGITGGLVGYALGNYVGIAMANLIRFLLQ